ncbi:C40 family peptidase [Saccharomonospora xinjiangensis]|uniref:Cell wall-associated hydrolase, invasion-associated protein n=1 Tax=Saccharomonospora xinjiangensis XJ-54 TaxID=882086 RepID=I0V5Z9_9PSEU|nr:C40 family peptidase [Saccharomonospora xinjiangensis]EID55552.1 cell wall-associated hydrolase, invasion-associated protein [Saccharomonospora xinjiangensis XJ-54]QBQ61468.1 putative endopeptidase p60 precursor [Saccharomonospora xinjiangensis]
MRASGGVRGRRLVIAAVAAAVVAVGVFVVALRHTPQHTGDTAAAMPPGPRTSSAQPVESTVTSSAPPASSVPATPGVIFESWVDDVAGWLDIPRPAMYAYASATVTLADEEPDCNLSWVTLAGVGRTATDHGRVEGGSLTDEGSMSEPIGTVEVRDFADKVISEPGAAGPLQLAPSVWNRFKASPTGDAPDIQDIDDAALTAGRALCDGGRDLSDGDDWLAGVSALQDEPLFLHRVLATANVYGTVSEKRTKPDAAALKAVTFAIDKIGLPYVWGGNGTEQGDAGFDCSGLTTAAYASAGISMMRTAHTQYHSVPLVKRGDELRLGDLIFFGDPDTKIHHVGIYIGNNQMIDAPTFGQAVQVHNYRKPGDNYAGAGRPSAA